MYQCLMVMRALELSSIDLIQRYKCELFTPPIQHIHY